MEKQIHVVFSNWSGHPFARVWASSQGKATNTRRLQYLNQNTKTGLAISVDIVSKKLQRQKRSLVDLARNRKNKTSHVEDALTIIEDSIKKIKVSNMTKERLIGLEGWCAKHYFTAISSMLPKKWQFAERSQHPAKDEFNAALNYIYGMGYSSVEKIIILSGLDPNAGFLHSDSYGKPTLSYDIIELARPYMDRIIVSLFSKKQVRPSWFEYQEDSVYLAKNGRLKIIEKYAENQKKVERETWDYCKKIIEMLGVGSN